MKTWEMIKKLTENPKKEFVLKSDRRVNVFMTVGGEVCYIVDGCDIVKPLKLDGWLKQEWEEVKEPVDFMEVLKRIKDSDGDIRLMLINDLYEVEIKNKTFDDVLYHLSIDYLDTSIADILLNGKWYIEED